MVLSFLICEMGALILTLKTYSESSIYMYHTLSPNTWHTVSAKIGFHNFCFNFKIIFCYISDFGKHFHCKKKNYILNLRLSQTLMFFLEERSCRRGGCAVFQNFLSLCTHMNMHLKIVLSYKAIAWCRYLPEICFFFSPKAFAMLALTGPPHP